MRRIVVVGVSGAGKSTLAERLSNRLDLVPLELDAFVHGPGWKPFPEETFRHEVRRRMGDGGWVCDGNYFTRTAWLWNEADTVIWLDPPLRRVLPRLLRRSIRRILTRQELWNGNRESWSALLKRGNVLTWAVASHRTLASELPARLADSADKGLHIVRLRSPREVELWWRRTFHDAPRGRAGGRGQASSFGSDH